MRLLGVDTAINAGLEVEDAGADVGVLAGADFAFAVEIPDWLGEGFENVGAGLVQDVPDVVGGDDVGFAAFEGAGEAEETDEVGVVGVEELSGDWSILLEKQVLRVFARYRICYDSCKSGNRRTLRLSCKSSPYRSVSHLPPDP